MPLHFSVYVNQKPVTVFHHEGKMFIEGRPGSEFSLRVQNQSNEDCEYIISVDGIDPDTNEFAGKTSKGKTISKGSTKHIMQNKDKISFIFSDLNQSISAYSGVIALKDNDSNDIISYYYDDKKGLERRGIKVNGLRSLPNPFPKY